MQKKSKIWIRVLKIITIASRYKCSLYAYITTLQHNVIGYFFFIKYNLPTNWLLLLCLKKQWKYVFIHPFLRWFIYAMTYDTLVLFFFHIVIELLNNWAMHGEFPPDAWLKLMLERKNIYKGEKMYFQQ